MGLTAFSFVLFPLCLLWLGSPDRLLKLMVLAAVFEAAAAAVFGNFGVQPALVPALGFIGFVLLQMLLGASYPGLAGRSALLRPFLLAVTWALAGSYAFPRLFENGVLVWPQKATFPFVLTPLAPSSANLNQDIYLAVNAVFVVTCAAYLTGRRGSLAPFVRVWFHSGFLVAAIAAWQFASRVGGVPFPESLFYSNPGWAILTEQQIGAVPRINGPFSEPSSLANYMASIVCATGWLLVRGRRDRTIRLLFVTGLMTIGLSTSTTGFAVLAMVAAGLPAYALLTGSTRLFASFAKLALPMLLLGALVVATASVFVPAFNKNVVEVMDATLNKQQSSSYEDRTGADLDSLTAMADTYGLGVGWGSNRSSSLVPGLLANIGVPGVLGLLWFGFLITRRVRAAHRLDCSPDQSLVMDACSGGLVGYLLGAMLSGPTINSITFFYLLALLIACTTQVSLDAGWRAAAATAGGRPVPTGGYGSA